MYDDFSKTPEALKYRLSNINEIIQNWRHLTLKDLDRSYDYIVEDSQDRCQKAQEKPIRQEGSN